MNTNDFEAVLCFQPNTIFLHVLRCTDLQGIDSIRSVSQAARVAVDANQTVVWTKIRRLLETAASWEREGLNLGFKNQRGTAPLATSCVKEPGGQLILWTSSPTGTARSIHYSGCHSS